MNLQMQDIQINFDIKSQETVLIQKLKTFSFRFTSRDVSHSDLHAEMSLIQIYKQRCMYPAY